MRSDLQHHLSDLIDALSATQDGASLDQRWQNILTRVFQSPLNVVDGKALQCEIADNGQRLIIPCIDRGHHYVLNATESSAKFNDEDVRLVESLIKLARHFISVQEALERGADEERRRIARDLHDDVAARMLTLIHSVKDQHNIDIARSILKSLRNAIYTLDSKTTTQISHALTDVRAELQDRLNSIGMQLFWSQQGDFGQLTFTPRQHINLHRMLHEITTNVIRHAEAQFMTIDIRLAESRLLIQACDNGRGFDMNACVPGKGIHNIQTRVQELQGQVSWRNHGGCCLDIVIPIQIPATC